MSYLSVRKLGALAILLASAQISRAQTLAPLSDDPIHFLNRGTTAQMMNDWSTGEIHAENNPDRSFRKIWVRMFPLLSVPLGDPYPNTQNVNEVALYNSGGLKIYAMDDRALLATGSSLQFNFATGQVRIDDVAYTLEPFWIMPQASVTTTAKWDQNLVRVELRGGFVVKPSLHEPKDLPPQTLWSLTNVVSVNEYLQSVVPSEVIASWHPETLRAQAIAARTYGAYETAMARASGKDFDVDPSTWYQSYQGFKIWIVNRNAWKTVELSATNIAVNATGSKVLTYNGEVIKSLFSANSGGRTCTFRECMEKDYDLPYLREVDDAPGVRAAPGGTWGSRANITPAGIKEKVATAGLQLQSAVKRVEHLEQGGSGRTWRLRLQLVDGTSVDLNRLQTRKVMHLYGPIRSFQYNLGVVGDGKQAVRGNGYGHAVGMSQWGAQLYAKSGWSASRILLHFYTGVKIQDLVAY